MALNKSLSRLLILFSMVLGTFACDDPTTIGSELQPGDLLVETEYVDTFNVRLRSFVYDTVNTMLSNNLLVGHVQDPHYGSVSARAYSELTIVNAGIKLLGDGATSDAVLDSTIMTVGLNYAYGDSARASKRRIIISETSQAIDTAGGKRYYQFDTLAIGRAVIVDTVVDFTSNTTSLKLIPEQAFIQKIFNWAAEGELSSQDAFQGLVKGVAFESDGTGDSMYGFSTSSTVIRFYYHYMKGQDTVRTNFSIFASGFRFNNIKANRTGTPIEGLDRGELIAEDNGNEAFLQAGTGVGIRALLPDLTAYGFANKIAINKAELWFSPVPGTISTASAPPSEFSLYLANEEGQPQIGTNGVFQELPVPRGQVAPKVTYISGGQTYSPIDVTVYAEQLANGKIPNRGFVLHPESLQENAINSVRIADGRHPGAYPIKLKIYYTKFQ